MLNQLAPDLWTADQPQRFGGFEVGTRVTVVRLPERRLFLHSPVRLTAALRAELDALGAPGFVIAPNRLHHLYAADYTTAFSDVQLFIAPGLQIKRPDLHATGILDDTAPPGWRDHIDQVVVRGYPILNEVVFSSRQSHLAYLRRQPGAYALGLPRLRRLRPLRPDAARTPLRPRPRRGPRQPATDPDLGFRPRYPRAWPRARKRGPRRTRKGLRVAALRRSAGERHS